MSYVAAGFTPDQEGQILERQVVIGERQKEIDAKVAEIIERQKREERNRRWTVVIAASGAVFAAIRLGILFVPKVRRRRLGTIGEGT